MENNILLNKVPIEMFQGKTVLLTGASGLIGTHFLMAFEEMVKKGIDVKVIGTCVHHPTAYLNRTTTGDWISLTFINLARVNLAPYFNDVDYIIHTATYGQPDRFTANADETIKLNTSVVIDLINKLPINGKFLFISSSEVYSGLTDPPFIEGEIGTTTPYHPRACYIEAKRCGESIIKEYSSIDAKSVRLSLAYGEGVRKNDQRAMYSFIRRAIENSTIQVGDSGSAQRTYIYAQDAVNMMLRVMLSGKKQLYNIGGISDVSIAQLALMIGRIIGVPVSFPKNTDGYLSGAPDWVRLSIERFEEEFGKQEFTPLEEGLKRTINYFKSLYNE